MSFKGLGAVWSLETQEVLYFYTEVCCTYLHTFNEQRKDGRKKERDSIMDNGMFKFCLPPS
jgi:hypothetical protein